MSKATEAMNAANTTHGMSGTKEYQIWNWMMTRCFNPNSTAFKHYGGRGISVCAKWRKFEGFFEDMGFRPSPDHTLERIDNNGNYCKANCAWATMSEQCSNRRSTKLIAFNGVIKSRREWERELGLPRGLLYARLTTLGWGVVKSFTTPVRPTGR